MTHHVKAESECGTLLQFSMPDMTLFVLSMRSKHEHEVQQCTDVEDS